jgi:uncharacterized protein (TIGR02687 family)
MINEKTINSLLDKFKKISDEERKLVFWYDTEKREDEDFDELNQVLQKNNIKLIIIKNNYFEIKKLIHTDDTKSDYLLYSSKPEPAYDSNWLLDIQLYSKIFSTSKISEIKSEFEITGYDLDMFLNKYKVFFDNKERIAALKKHFQKDWKEKEFVIGFLSVISKSNTTDLKEILRNILSKSLDQDKNLVYKEIIRFKLEEDFWRQMNIHFGYKSENPTLEKLFLSFILTHIKTKTPIVFEKTDDEYINSLKNESEIFIQNWMENSKQSPVFEKYSKKVSEKISSNELHTNIISQIEKLDIKDFVEAESVEIFDRYVILRIIDNLINRKQDFNKYIDYIERRRTKYFFNNYENIYNSLDHAVHLFKFSTENPRIEKKNFKDLFETYINIWYNIDYHYRNFYFYCDKDLEKEVIKKLQPEIENLYNNKLLDKFLTAWSESIELQLESKWEYTTILSQIKFFKDKIERITGKNEKVAVIVSDALRYEVAYELKHLIQLLQLFHFYL